ncbi:MAG: aspartate aminotransferase family protein [Candidatus Nanopelagicales bacterium]
MSNDYQGNPEEGKKVFDLDRAHVFHSWSAQGAIKPMPIAKAEGSYLWDYDGKKYLDFSCQLVNTNIGHQHPKVVKAIQEQAGRLTTIAPQHANDMRGIAAKKLSELAPNGFEHVFFTNGGADAIENAVRMARIHTKRHKVLTFYRSYHGNTGTAIQMTGDPRRWPNEFAYGVIHFFGPFPYRSQFWSNSPEQETERALHHLESVIQFEGPATIAAICIETVVGTAGIMAPTPGYLEGLRKICDKYGILWIADEVMAGFGRTGKWFAFDNWTARPDLIVFAKGSNSGYVPAGGVIIDKPIYETFVDKVFPGGLTYSGHPLAMSSIVATLDAMKEEKMVENAFEIGKNIIGPKLNELKEKHSSIGEVRGLGVFWAIEFVKNKNTKEALVPYNASGKDAAPMVELGGECKKLGLMPFINMNRLHVVPPCNVSKEDAIKGLEILDQAITVLDKYTN